MPEGDNELAILRLAWRVDALDKWRKQASDEIAQLRKELENVTNEQKIAAGVAAELQKRGALRRASDQPATLSLTWYQKLGGAVAGALLVADAVRGLLS